jgi:hypothetical protein
MAIADTQDRKNLRISRRYRVRSARQCPGRTKPVAPVAPAVGEPLAEPGARNLPAELGLKPAAGVASPVPRGARDVAQLSAHVRLQ